MKKARDYTAAPATGKPPKTQAGVARNRGTGVKTSGKMKGY